MKQKPSLCQEVLKRLLRVGPIQVKVGSSSRVGPYQVKGRTECVGAVSPRRQFQRSGEVYITHREDVKGWPRSIVSTGAKFKMSNEILQASKSSLGQLQVQVQDIAGRPRSAEGLYTKNCRREVNTGAGSRLSLPSGSMKRHDAVEEAAARHALHQQLSSSRKIKSEMSWL